MFIVTAEQMRAVDEHTIHQLGIPAASLMENAGRAIAEEVIKLCREGQAEGRLADSGQLGYSGKTDARRAHTGPGDRQGYGGDIIADPALVMERPGDQQWYMLIGKGNNGGDGLVAARHLVEAGLGVTLVYADAPDALRGEAAVQRDAAAQLGIPALVHGREAVDFSRCTASWMRCWAPARGSAARSLRGAVGGERQRQVGRVRGCAERAERRHRRGVQALHSSPGDPCLALLKRGLVPGHFCRGAHCGARHRHSRAACARAWPLGPSADGRGAARCAARGYRPSPGTGRPQRGHVRPRVAGRSRMYRDERRWPALGQGRAARRLRARHMGVARGAAAACHRHRAELAAASDGDSGEWNAASADAVLRLAESRDVLATGQALAASRATQTGCAVCGNIRIVRSSSTRTPSTCWQTLAHMGLATGASEVPRQS